MKCSSCGSGVADGASACQACGAPVAPVAAGVGASASAASGPATAVSVRAGTGPRPAVSPRPARPLSNREEKVVVPVRVGDVLSARYRLEQKIGEGGMGTVYVAHDLELERHVAVKLLAANLVMDDEVVERFEREARLNAKLDHPNIAPVYDVGRHEGRPFIVMKLLEGDTLAGLLRSKGGFSSDETLKLMRQLAAGLDYIHGRGFIHRDIKAGNIFVSPEGHATILDFGILRPKTGGQGITRTGMVMGTPHYMAPEQALGLRDVDHRVDIYAMAVVLFECLTGTLPFEADSELRLVQMQAHQPPPDVLTRAPWIARPVADVMLRALAKRPDDRFNSGAELVKALEAAYRDSGGHAAAPPPKPTEGTAPGWRMKAGLLQSLRERDSAMQAAAVPSAGAGPASPGGVLPHGAGPSSSVTGAGHASPGGAGVASHGAAASPSTVATGHGSSPGGVPPHGAGPSPAAAGAGHASPGGAGVPAHGAAASPSTAGPGSPGGAASPSGVLPQAATPSPHAEGPGPGASQASSTGALHGATTDTAASRAGQAAFDGAAASSASRRGLVAFGFLAAALVVVGLVAWQPWVRPVDPTDTPRVLAADAGAASPLAAGPDAGAAEAADAGLALAVADAPDAGAAVPEDAGTRVAVVEKHPAGKKNGRVNVITTHGGEPWWAQVSIDGVPRGRTPILLDLPVGRYQLRVERAGFRPEQREIKVASGKSTVLRIDLVP